MQIVIHKILSLPYDTNHFLNATDQTFPVVLLFLKPEYSKLNFLSYI